MTNADDAWLNELKALAVPKGWHVTTTRDLDLTWQERGVDSAIGVYLLLLVSGLS